MRFVNLPVFLAFALFAAGPAFAQTTTCVGSNASLSLGTYEAYQATNLDSSGVFVVNCSRSGGPGNTTVTLGLGQSLNSGSIAARKLKAAAAPDLLDYNFYRDAARSQVWGETIGVNTVSQTQHLPNNSTRAFTFPVFGRINALQDVRAGSYSDALVLTVTF